ncbi:ninja-family protein AFP2-like [Trifolium pratense]|uniref:ninja-family protein AFP2-like n=1 Tax=Trifolium pratense TaxID=57577 RepID=UPI001E6903AD|nr:ninja-family protein AFP2-like [Trifolium pratense]
MVEFEEVELDLGLSIGGAFKKPVQKSKPELESGLTGLYSGENQSNEMQKMDQKREILALRRMEAKRKREQKKGTENRFGEPEPECEPVFKKEKMEFVNGAVSWMAPFQVVQAQQYGAVQFVPLNNGMALPFWYGSEKNVGGIDGVSFNGGDGKVKSNGDSSRCSSSAVSDYQSSSREDGGSTDSHSRSRSHSSNSFAELTQLKNSKETNTRKTQPEEIASSHPTRNHNNVNESQTHPNNMQLQQNPMKHNAQPATIPMKKPLPQMPYVSTKGNGPNGKTVNGFLYTYSKCDEVSIVCVCHGSTFSPAEFVQHAGGTDITHPLRHITVNSSAFG